ncbi:hypothetical protein EV426DRAFT_615551 [Tirmania nivea]|nr:hypothetical protein EV426DRAFT_615551 [Tirmania nivea]
MYYRFATSLLQGPAKGMGKDVGRLVRKVIFDVPREENVHRGVFIYKARFASIPRAIEAILCCCPLIMWIEIRGCFPRGLETIAVTRVIRSHSKALRVTYNANVGLVPYGLQPRQYNDPTQFKDGTWVRLQSAPGSFQATAPFNMWGLEYDEICNMQNLQRLDLSLELSSVTFPIPYNQDNNIAVRLSKVAISILNIEIHFRDWYLGELEHTLTQGNIINFFGLIAQNSHLKRLEIVSLHIPPRCRYWSPPGSTVHQEPEYKALQGLAASEWVGEHLKTWIQSDLTGRLRKIVKLDRKVVDTVFPTTFTRFYQGVDMPPYNLCRSWYNRFTRQYNKAGNL